MGTARMKQDTEEGKLKTAEYEKIAEVGTKEKKSINGLAIARAYRLLHDEVDELPNLHL